MVECKLIDRERRDIPKIVVVGDEKIGKSTLIAHLLGLDKNLQPVSNGGGCYFTILDNVVAPIPHEPVMSNAGEQLTGSSFLASIWDTCGEEGYDRLRPLVYPDTELFIVCFSVVDRTSFDHVMEKWDQETRFFCPTANKILVGLKTDVRDGQTYHDCSDSDDDEIAMEKPGLHAVSNHVQDTVTTKQGQESGRLLDDWWYTEGEALTGKGLEHIGDLVSTPNAYAVTLLSQTLRIDPYRLSLS
ncbi:MAG: hypothetical protein M1828_000065 [Chrysothrix sp. TS-e1954]|nr:MAG: hypothetical protein M1828_000065 [Chrysothrix sp. TS-e1954]